MAVFLVVAGSPGSALTWAAIIATCKTIGAAGALAIGGASIAISVTLQPLQFRLVQLLEGYWPIGHKGIAFRAGLAYQRWRWHRLQRRLVSNGDNLGENARRAADERMEDAEARMRERFPNPDRLLPTGLGNALRAFEDRVGLRYDFDTVVIWPRLFRLLPKDLQDSIDDEVTQLDVSTRLVVTWAATALFGTTLLVASPRDTVHHPEWALIVAGLWALAWASYHAAIESAIAHALDVEVAIDLYRSLVVDAMNMVPSRRLSEDRRRFRLLGRLYSTYDRDHTLEVHFTQESK